MNDDTITYSYDSFSRRLSRTSDQISVQYLYQFDTEIAALANNKIVEFKAIHGQFSPYAIELNDKVYTPIRNHRGDITVLLDSEQNTVSTYRYDAFGEFFHYGNVQSPWLFSSQRYDTSTKNYHFINREYDSYTGRWLTPDPLGFEDGLNLYAYVHNNPMIYVDPYGLWGEGVFDYGRSVLASPRFHGACQMFGGAAEMGAGAAIAGGSGGLAAPIGFFAIGHGFDRFWTGTRQLVTGRQIDTATSQLMQQAGMSRQTANFVDDVTTMGTTMAGTAARRAAEAAAPQFKYPQSTAPTPKTENVFPKDSKDLLPNAYRDKKGYIYASDHIRIKLEIHLEKIGEVFNPRHHGNHYHIDIRINPSISWENIKNTYYLKPNNYVPKMGTGFLPGESFPGS